MFFHAAIVSRNVSGFIRPHENKEFLNLGFGSKQYHTSLSKLNEGSNEIIFHVILEVEVLEIIFARGDVHCQNLLLLKQMILGANRQNVSKNESRKHKHIHS